MIFIVKKNASNLLITYYEQKFVVKQVITSAIPKFDKQIAENIYIRGKTDLSTIHSGALIAIYASKHSGKATRKKMIEFIENEVKL